MKILIIKISSMGDIIHTLPAITDAANAVPNIIFDWIVEKNFSAIPQWHPHVHKIIPIQLRLWKKKWYTFFAWKEYLTFVKELSKRKYDIIIDAQGLLKTSLLITQFTHGIKHGMDYKSSKEPISCLSYNKIYQINKYQHAITRIRKLFSYSIQYPLPCSSAQYNIRNTLLSSKITLFNEVNPCLIFFHATTHKKKHWPEKYWNKIIYYAINSNYHIKIPFWTKNEESRVNRLKKKFNQIIILPRLTLQEIANQMLTATAIISVDTGLSHLAAALNCPNLTLYGPTNPDLIGVQGYNQTILRSKTKKMQDLTPDYVWSIFQKKLKFINESSNIINHKKIIT